MLVALNARLQSEVSYLVRMEPGIQPPDDTLAKRSGSCRDSGWLLVQIIRHMGLAARFVSGYLIQLVADQKPLDGPAGPTADFTDLHAWAEVYLPGAGWIGLDPTSGLLAGEGHIPLAATAFPSSAAPVTGFTDVCESTLHFEMSVTRIHEDPRVTRPYNDAQWRDIDALGRAVDAELQSLDVRLTQGGEPTFVSIDDMDGPEWNYTALSPKKWTLAESLAWRLRERFAPGALMFYGQGKWYPGEPLPRWALGIQWRTDGTPVWRDASLMASAAQPADATLDHARRFAASLAQALGLAPTDLIDAYEDPLPALLQEQNLPVNLDPAKVPMKAYDDRSRLSRTLARGLDQPAGFVLPLRAAEVGGPAWETSPWPVRREQLFLLPGDSPLGYRLPLASLPDRLPEETEPDFDRDPFDPRGNLHDSHAAAEAARHGRRRGSTPREVIRTALCVEVRDGRVHVFLPPMQRLEDFLDLIALVEKAAGEAKVPVRVEGYGPPRDPRLRLLNVTPDPGVIEVNIHPATAWDDLTANTFTLYEEARQSRLGTEKFMLDGRHTGTGGGNHVTLGGATPADSPFLRRPDLLRSLITYWQNHPALSYLFSGTFIGPTSQAPRVDEARDDNLYELEIAFQQMSAALTEGREADFPWLVDRLLRNLLVDLTGNTHRAEFSIDKLYSPDGPTGRLGLVEFRAFEMPPHRADEPRADAAAARAGRALLEAAVRGAPGPLGHPAARPLDAAALRRAGHPRRRRRSRRGRISLPPRVVRAVPRIPLPALRHRRPPGRESRTAPGDRAVARARRGDERQRHRALRRLVGGAHAGQGARHDRRAPHRRVQRPRRAAASDRRARRVRRRRALQGMGAVFGAASDHRRAHAAGVRRRRHLERARHRRLHVSRVASGRPQLRDLPGERQRSRGAALRAVLGPRPHARADAGRARTANRHFPFTLDLRRKP